MKKLFILVGICLMGISLLASPIILNIGGKLISISPPSDLPPIVNIPANAIVTITIAGQTNYQTAWSNLENQMVAGNVLAINGVNVTNFLAQPTIPNQILIYTNTLGQNFPINSLGTYTLCFTNASGYSVYTNNLSVTTNVIVNTIAQGSYQQAGFNLVPSNQIPSPVTFDICPNNTSIPFSPLFADGWVDFLGPYSGTVQASNLTYYSYAQIVQTAIQANSSTISSNSLSTIVSMPYITVLTPLSYSITNGTPITFPDTTTMWLNIATNPVWTYYTNSVYNYTYGGTVYVKDGDNFLNTNLQFASGIHFSNTAWHVGIIGTSPDQSTLIWPLMTNCPVEGLISFGYAHTNANGSGSQNYGTIDIENMGLYAQNQSNSIVCVFGANSGIITHNFVGDGGGNLINGNRQMIATGRGSNVSLNGMKFVSLYDNQLIVFNNFFNYGNDGVVEDCDHAYNLCNTGGGLWGALIHSHCNVQEFDLGNHAFACSNLIEYDSSLFPFPTLVDTVIGNYQDDATTWGLNINSSPGGTEQQFNVIANCGFEVPFTITNPAAEMINGQFMQTASGTLLSGAPALLKFSGVGTTYPQMLASQSNLLDDAHGNANFYGNITTAQTIVFSGANGVATQNGQTMLNSSSSGQAIALGYEVPSVLSGYNNDVIIGALAALNVGSGAQNDVIIGRGAYANSGAGTHEVIIGCNSGQTLGGNANTFVGDTIIAGANPTLTDCTALGANAALALIAGSGDIYIGFGAGSVVTNANNSIEIGNTGLAGDGSITRIGTGQTNCFIAGYPIFATNASIPFPPSIPGQVVQAYIGGTNWWFSLIRTNHIP